MSKIEYLVAERKSWGSIYARGYGFTDYEGAFFSTVGKDGWELISDDGVNMRFKRIVNDEPEESYNYSSYNCDNNSDYDDDDDGETEFYLEQINDVLSDLNKRIEQVRYTESIILALLQDIAEKVCPDSLALLDLKQLMSEAKSDTEPKTPVAKETQEQPKTNDMIAGFADEHIEVAFAGYENEDKTLDLFARLAGLAGFLPHQSAEDHFAYMIQAVYRFYNKELNEKVKECYCKAINSMACYFSSPATIETLNTMAVNAMTVSSATDIFFGVAIKQLSFEQSNDSPFVVEEMSEFINIFVNQVNENPDLSSDNELMAKIEKHIKYIKQEFGLNF